MAMKKKVASATPNKTKRKKKYKSLKSKSKRPKRDDSSGRAKDQIDAIKKEAITTRSSVHTYRGDLTH